MHVKQNVVCITTLGKFIPGNCCCACAMRSVCTAPGTNEMLSSVGEKNLCLSQTLSADRVLALLVLRDLVQGVLLALGPRAEGLHLLRDCDHFRWFEHTTKNNKKTTKTKRGKTMKAKRTENWVIMTSFTLNNTKAESGKCFSKSMTSYCYARVTCCVCLKKGHANCFSQEKQYPITMPFFECLHSVLSTFPFACLSCHFRDCCVNCMSERQACARHRAA